MKTQTKEIRRETVTKLKELDYQNYDCKNKILIKIRLIKSYILMGKDGIKDTKLKKEVLSIVKWNKYHCVEDLQDAGWKVRISRQQERRRKRCEKRYERRHKK